MRTGKWRARERDGRYALSNNERPCRCGHTLGDHASQIEPGEPRGCLYGRIGLENEAPPCDCVRFRRKPLPKKDDPLRDVLFTTAGRARRAAKEAV